MKRYQWKNLKIPAILLITIIVCLTLLVLYFKFNPNIIEKKEAEATERYVNEYILEGVNKYRISQVKEEDNGDYVVEEIYNYRELQKELKSLGVQKVLDILGKYEYSSEIEDKSPFLILNEYRGNCQAISLFIYDFLEVNFENLEQELIETNTPFHLYNKVVYNEKTYLIDMSKDKEDGLHQLKLLISDLN